MKLNMFGRDYEEIGSSDKGLILKGKIKILWGKKLIDLLDSNGNLNVKVLNLIKKVSSESDIKLDGFYYFDGNLVVKVGDNIIELTNISGTTYVSFVQEQETTGELKYTALLNIGFIYSSQKDSNIYPTNGIIYIEDSQSLFIVKDGILSKYTISIPNPFPKLFVIQKNEEDSSDGALVIQGEGKSNSLLFNTLKVYAKGIYSILETDKELLFLVGNHKIAIINLTGILTDGIKSFGANDYSGYRIWENNGKYILDIDQINIRDAEEPKFYEDEIYSSRFHLNSCEIVSYLEDEESGISRLQQIYYNLLENTEIILNNSIVHIPIKVVECRKTSQYIKGEVVEYLIPRNYVPKTTPEGTNDYPKESIYRLEFICNSNVLYPVINVLNNISNIVYNTYTIFNPFIGKYPYLFVDGEIYNYIRFDNISLDPIYYVFKNSLSETLKNKSVYIISENNSNLRICFDFKNLLITLKQNALFENITHLQKILTKIGNISDYETYSDDMLNQYGLFSNKSIFIGGQFRQPLPTYTGILDENGNIIEIKEKEIEYKSKDFPRYSTELCENVKEFITNDEIILPRKYALKVTIEDFTDIIPTINFINPEEESINYNIYEFPEDTILYDGKLLLLKISGINNFGSRIKITETIYPLIIDEDSDQDLEPLILNYYYPILKNGNEILENIDFDNGNVILIKYNSSNKNFNYLCGNSCKSNIITDYTDISATSAIYVINNKEFIDGLFILIKIIGISSLELKIQTTFEESDNEYDIIYNNGVNVKESDFDLNSIIMLKYDGTKFVYYLGGKKDTYPQVGLGTSSDIFGTSSTGVTEKTKEITFFDSDTITAEKGVHNYRTANYSEVDLKFKLSDVVMKLLGDLCTATGVTNPFV